jgi:hypothetical protein
MKAIPKDNLVTPGGYDFNFEAAPQFVRSKRGRVMLSVIKDGITIIKVVLTSKPTDSTDTSVNKHRSFGSVTPMVRTTVNILLYIIIPATIIIPMRL